MSRAVPILAMFWVSVLAMLWLTGCGIPITLRLETVPPPDQRRWADEMTNRVNDHELRVRELERRVAEEDAL